MVAADVQTDVTSVTFSYDDGDKGMYLATLESRLVAIHGFLTVAHMMAQYDSRENTFLTFYDARDAVDDLTIHRISYNSPLEIVMAISGAFGSAVGVARSAIYLYERINTARANVAASKRRRVTEEAVMEAISAMRPMATAVVMDESVINQAIEAALAATVTVQGVE